MKAPFPWFGGKRKVASIVWERFGDVRNYVEPFAGSLAVLLARPEVDYDRLPLETVNDKDALIANFWRAVAADPEQVAYYADWPPNENEMHARHVWIMGQLADHTARVEADPDCYDCRVAGYWLYGICLWIGSGWCSGNGPWHSVEIDGSRKLLHLGDNGRGINRKRLHLGNNGQGINRQRLHLGTWKIKNSVNDAKPEMGIMAYMTALQSRLRRVRVASGDWTRVTGPTVTHKHGLTGVFLDPPYATEANRAELYKEDDFSISHDVREWALANGDNPLMRIALCGYEREHGPHMPATWRCVAWNAGAGYAAQATSGASDNGKQERIWFSPHCLMPESELWQQQVLL